MRVWRRLKRWADEEARSSRIYTNLAEAAEEHAAGKREPVARSGTAACARLAGKEPAKRGVGVALSSGFAAALRFLTQSSDARDAERSERQRQRRRELAAEQEKAAIQARTPSA